jgi:hypothetical protein
LEDLSYEEGVNMVEEFYEYLRRKFEYAESELRRWNVDVERLPLRSWGHFIVDRVKDFFAGKDYNDILIYGETMGFLKDHGSNKWKVFEGSDEPDELDMYLYRRLILAGEGVSKKKKLYSMQNIDFVESWRSEGIPPDVYFSSKCEIALHYWRPRGADVLVEVELPADAVVETAEFEYKTLRRVAPHEFKIRF